MKGYAIMQEANNGHKLTLSPRNYGEFFPTYNQAYRFLKKHRTDFFYKILRTDRISAVTAKYERERN